LLYEKSLNLTQQREALVISKALFVDITVRVFVEETNDIQINGSSKQDGSSSSVGRVISKRLIT
jgi:hypothetical protein